MVRKPFQKLEKRTGRKPFQINPAEILQLAQLGCSKDEIAAILSPDYPRKLLNANNLEKRFHAVMVKGRMLLHRSLKHELVERALSGNTAALIFALKCYCKMDDRNGSETEGQHLTIHFDYNQAKSIETRAVPIREAVTNMLANYRKDLANPTEDVMEVDSTPLLEDS